ncbi:hypothetical protein H5410_021544 [Solanum commersonii]|uniref:Uncharacterized protein n=1 Tax=Solanum commersonii TaxID=4109 RepID=A0A9J5ZE97_SOLCO|nr:hypothetical protein H5410_021544 [Solanum commersonii]
MPNHSASSTQLTEQSNLLDFYRDLNFSPAAHENKVKPLFYAIEPRPILPMTLEYSDLPRFGKNWPIDIFCP